MKRKTQLMLAGAGTALLFLILVGFVYSLLNPPLHDHAHCITVAQGMLDLYASKHGGQYPYHTNGYGDAILVLTTNKGDFKFFTANGYSIGVFVDALRSGTDVPEQKVGRVYVQGLTTSNSSNIAFLFDKKSRRGGREVIGGPIGGYVTDGEWPEFAKGQIELIVKVGIPREVAEAYYAEEPRRR